MSRHPESRELMKQETNLPHLQPAPSFTEVCPVKDSFPDSFSEASIVRNFSEQNTEDRAQANDHSCESFLYHFRISRDRSIAGITTATEIRYQVSRNPIPGCYSSENGLGSFAKLFTQFSEKRPRKSQPRRSSLNRGNIAVRYYVSGSINRSSSISHY